MLFKCQVSVKEIHWNSMRISHCTQKLLKELKVQLFESCRSQLFRWSWQLVCQSFEDWKAQMTSFH